MQWDIGNYSNGVCTQWHGHQCLDLLTFLLRKQSWQFINQVILNLSCSNRRDCKSKSWCCPRSCIQTCPKQPLFSGFQVPLPDVIGPICLRLILRHFGKGPWDLSGDGPLTLQSSCQLLQGKASVSLSLLVLITNPLPREPPCRAPTPPHDRLYRRKDCVNPHCFWQRWLMASEP